MLSHLKTFNKSGIISTHYSLQIHSRLTFAQSKQEREDARIPFQFDINVPIYSDVYQQSIKKLISSKRMQKHIKWFRKLGFKSKFNYNKSNERLIDKETYVFGHLNTYPKRANKNLSQFFNSMSTKIGAQFSLKSNWISNATNNDIGIDIKTTVDYYPFNRTFVQKKFWKREENNPYLNEFKDNKVYDVDGYDLPYLKRNKQELIIFREEHSHLNNLRIMNRLLNIYKPTRIVLEIPPSIDLRKFEKAKLKGYTWFLRNTYGFIGNKWMTSFLGRIFMRIGRIFGGVGAGSYGTTQAILYSLNNGISITLGDLPESLREPLSKFALYADEFNKIKQIIVSKSEFYKKVWKGDISLDLQYYIGCLTHSHTQIFTEFRNDLISLCINESNDDRILLIVGGFHGNDVINKITKENNKNPFKTINKQYCILKWNEYSTFNDNKYNILSKEDKQLLTQIIGDKYMPILSINNDNDIKNIDNFDDIIQEQSRYLTKL